MKRVVIVGAGMAGLSAAWYLERMAEAAGLAVACTVLEPNPWLGGKVHTDRVDGAVIEAGPDSFIGQKPWATDLIREVGLGEQLIGSRDHLQRVCLVHRRRLVPFPKGFRLAVPTQWRPFVMSPLLSPLGKLRIAGDFLLPARSGDDDESVASFIGRRLGQETLDRIAGPLMAGIYSGDPAHMSIRATFPMLVEMEHRHGSLIRAMLRTLRHSPRAGGGNHPGGMFVSLRDGMGALPERLGVRLRADLRTGCGATSIGRDGGRYVVSTQAGDAIAADAVVLAAPAPAAASLLESLAPAIARRLRAIRHLGTATLSLRYDRAGFTALRDGVGPAFIVPLREQGTVTACTTSSCKFAHRTDPDTVLLRVFVGGPRNGALIDLPDDQLLAAVCEDLRNLLGIEQSPRGVYIHRWPNANPQYDVGHLDRMRELDAALAAFPGLHLAGCAYRGIGVPDIVRQGKEAARQIVGSPPIETPFSQDRA